tara:strand:+ start:487 stop:894 length:408 start_codon:yes stop_codon:yes gene_type:complete
MNNQIEIVYEGDLRTKATHLASGSEILTDAPIDNQGKGEKFSPTDLVATAIGSCMLTIMGITSNVHNINIDGALVRVEKIMGKDPRKINQINLEIIFKSSVNSKDKIILERAAKHCPVAKTLEGNIEENIKFIYP